MINGYEDSFFEIFTSINFSKTKIIIWTKGDPEPKQLLDDINEESYKFCRYLSLLVDIIDMEYSIDNEKKQVKKITEGLELKSIVNLYYFHLKAGKDILNLSFELSPDRDDFYDKLMSDENDNKIIELHRKEKALCSSSSVCFLMALEGFINTLYELFLKPEYSHNAYARSALKSNLDLRILQLPFYCHGFSNADISPDSIEYTNWLDIRAFRNNMVHANVTKKIQDITTTEDSFVFNYNSLLRRKQSDDKFQLPFNPIYIAAADSIDVLDKVREIVYEITEKADDDIKRWIKSWINEPFINLHELQEIIPDS